MCVSLVCVQVCNCGSGTVSKCISVDPVQSPHVCGSGTVSRCVTVDLVLCPGI